MTRNEIKSKFPWASESFIKANAVDKDYLPDNVSVVPIPYTPEEDEKILEFYRSRNGQSVNLNELALLLGRSRWSVAMRASRIAVTESSRPKSESAKLNMSKAQKLINETQPELIKRKSESQKSWLKKHGHPRGFLGHKRTSEELENMRAGAAKAWSDPTHRVNSKEFRQQISDRASAMQSSRKPSHCFSRTRYGVREDLGLFFRSSWEANYARYLNWCIKHEGKIEKWDYEPETFWFHKIQRGCRSYKPDFRVLFKDGHIERHEVKGWMYPRAKTALKRMRIYHPEIEIVLIDQTRYKALSKQMKKLIKEWE